MNSSCSGGMPHARAAARASVSRISPLIFSTSVGVRLARLLRVQERLDPLLDTAVGASGVDAEQPVELSTKSTNRRASWSKTAMFPLVMYATWTLCPCSTRRMIVPPIEITSSSGCGLNTRTVFGSAAGRVVLDRRQPVLEDLLAERLGRAMFPEQVVQVMVAEIQRRSASAAPSSPPGSARRPPAGSGPASSRPWPTSHGRRNDRQLAGRRLVEEERGIRVVLEEAARRSPRSAAARPPCRTIGALCSPNAIRTTLRASRMVPTPIVMACCGTFSSPKKSPAASRRVTGSSVTSRVRLLRVEPGSLNPMCPVRPMPRIWMSIPPALRISSS